jgi:hypothetical protein
MAVLPEASMSILVGEAIRHQLSPHKHSIKEASHVASLITFLAGLVTLSAGLLRSLFGKKKFQKNIDINNTLGWAFWMLSDHLYAHRLLF